MERINRYDPSEHAAILRLLLAVTLSISLHGAAAWLLPGPVFPSYASTLRASITAPFAESPATRSTTVPRTDSAWVPALNSRRLQNGFASIEAVDPTYYTADEVDVFPAPRHPIRADGTPAGGYVRVLVRIDASGRVTGTRVFDSSGTDGENDAAMLAISRTLFISARRGGSNVRSEVVIELAAERQG